MEQQCIFCGIVNGSVPSKTIYEDSIVRVILDIYPANPAHMIVITKNHYAIFNQLTKEEAEHLGVVAKKLSDLVFKLLKPEGINFFIANGAVAGQKAPHFILHIIPRFQGDGLNFEAAEKEADEKQTNEFYDKLKPTLKDYFPDVDFDKEIEVKEAEKKEEPKKQEEAKPEAKKEEADLDKITEMFT